MLESNWRLKNNGLVESSWGSGGSSGSSSGVSQTVTGGDSTSVQAGIVVPYSTTTTTSTPQVGSLNPSNSSTGGFIWCGSSGSSGGYLVVEVREVLWFIWWTTIQQMIDVTNTAQQTIQQQSQQSQAKPSINTILST